MRKPVRNPAKGWRIKELSEALREIVEGCVKFRQDRGRHEGEHDFSLTVCQSCDTAYVQAESVFDEQVERARAVLSEG